MKIAVISDTHIKVKNIGLLQSFLEKLQDVDMIIHCGDFISFEAYKLLEKFKKTISVCGNVDDFQCQKELKIKEIFNVNDLNIGIFHGHGSKGETLKRVKDMFKDDKVDMIVFGHSHKPCIFTENNIVFINPGSPFYKRKEPYFSYIVINLQKGNIDVSIKFFKHMKDC